MRTVNNATTEGKAMARAFEVYAINAAQAVDFKTTG